MPPTAERTGEDQRASAAGHCGKLVIIGIVAVALAAAGTSWLVRYNATHRAAEFWGPWAAELIRDAPIVDLCTLGPSELAATGFAPLEPDSGKRVYVTKHFDVSNARGMTHLRNALLEDRSYLWPWRRLPNDPPWKWMLGFRDDKRVRRVSVLITGDCSELEFIESAHGKVLSCEPIAAGLAEMFAEMSQEPAAPAR